MWMSVVSAAVAVAAAVVVVVVVAMADVDISDDVYSPVHQLFVVCVDVLV